MTDKEKFGQALLTLRKEKNMSQKELAARLNVTPAAVSKWEHGQNYPDITMISTIAGIFEVSCDALLQPDKILNPQAYDEASPEIANIATTASTAQSESNTPADELTHPETNTHVGELTHSVTATQSIFRRKWLPVFLALTLLLTVSSFGLYKLYAKANASPFEIISTRSTETVTNEFIYEVAVLCQGEPESEEINEYCLELRELYESGEFGTTAFPTMKVLFYTDVEAVGSFEEGRAVLVTYLYFE